MPNAIFVRKGVGVGVGVDCKMCGCMCVCVWDGWMEVLMICTTRSSTAKTQNKKKKKSVGCDILEKYAM